MMNETLGMKSNLYETLYLTNDEIAYVDIDFHNLGLKFDSSYVLVDSETIENEDHIVGIEFMKSIKDPFGLLLVKSTNDDLLKENLSELFKEYEISVNLSVVKKIGSTIKEVMIVVSIYKNQDLWEEFSNV